jgi:hypothetical protein
MTAEFEYRLAVGWITKTALEASDSYLLTNFPLQADQGSIFLNPWGPPDDFSTYPAFTRYGQFTNQTQWADGAIIFDWDLAYLTENMIGYIEGLLWGGVGMYANAVTQSYPITVKTLKHHDYEFGVYQGYANKPIPNKSYRRGVRGVESYKMPFVGCTEIFA